MTYPLREQRQNGYVRVDLSRPDERNVLDAALIDAMLDALSRAEAADGTLAFVIAASGADFCAGMRLGRAELLDWQAGDIRPVATLLYRLATTPLVSIALVDGAATGGGVGLAAACDRVIAGPRAAFRLTEILLGLVPAAILPVLVRRLGEHRAFTLALTAQSLGPEKALGIGLADEIAPEPEAALRAFLAGLRRAEPGALCALKAYRNALHPLAPQPAAPAMTAVRDGIEAQTVLRRVERLREAGLVP